MPEKTLCVQRKLFKEKVIVDIFAYALCCNSPSTAGQKYFRNKYFRSIKLAPFPCVSSSGGKYKDAGGVWLRFSLALGASRS